MLAMENPHQVPNRNGPIEYGHVISRHSHPSSTRSPPLSLSWLDLKVFYVRVTNSDIDDSTPEHLTLNHIPLDRDTLLEVNGVRTSIYSDGISSLLRRDRLDKKSEEVTFVCTDSIRFSGSVKFEVFDKDVILLCGSLELCSSSETESGGHKWNMVCETDLVSGNGFLKGKYSGLESVMPKIEVFVAGCFDGAPIILTKTIQIGFRKKQLRKGMLDSIPEYEGSEGRKGDSSGLALQALDYANYKSENEDYNEVYMNTDYYEGEDEELSWFNAGVRVGVGIGLSMCVGIGIGVGLLVRTYQGATRNVFRRRLL